MGMITYEKLRSYSYSNDKLIKGEIKGVAVNFTGLGGSAMQEDNERAIRFAAHGIILLTPYNDPWCWMNDQAVAYTDEVVNVIFEHYGLDESTPIAHIGGSMGGLSALVYTKYAKRTPKTCVVNCPVCDLPYHFTERPDLPRTLYNAFFSEADDLQAAMEKRSPLHLASVMPDVQYHLFHCEWDTAVFKDKHSDKLYEAMKDGHSITYDAVPQRGHCALTPEAAKKYEQYIFTELNAL